MLKRQIFHPRRLLENHAPENVDPDTCFDTIIVAKEMANVSFDHLGDADAGGQRGEPPAEANN